MGKFDWKKLIAGVAPGLATALGGPLAGAATSVLAKAVLGAETATEEELEAALAVAKPETLAAIRKADQDFAAKMKELDIDVDRIHASDRDSARKREIATGDKTPALLALGITLGFFGILSFMLTNELPERGQDALLVMLGSLGTAWASVVSYFFGSSAGSKQKTEALARANRG